MSVITKHDSKQEKASLLLLKRCETNKKKLNFFGNSDAGDENSRGELGLKNRGIKESRNFFIKSSSGMDQNRRKKDQKLWPHRDFGPPRFVLRWLLASEFKAWYYRRDACSFSAHNSYYCPRDVCVCV